MELHEINDKPNDNTSRPKKWKSDKTFDDDVWNDDMIMNKCQTFRTNRANVYIQIASV